MSAPALLAVGDRVTTPLGRHGRVVRWRSDGRVDVRYDEMPAEGPPLALFGLSGQARVFAREVPLHPSLLVRE